MSSSSPPTIPSLTFSSSSPNVAQSVKLPSLLNRSTPTMVRRQNSILASPLSARNRILRSDSADYTEQPLFHSKSSPLVCEPVVSSSSSHSKCSESRSGPILSVPADSVDRSDWRKRAFTSNSDLLDLKQRINPLARALSFVTIYQPGRKGVVQNLSREDVIQLIIQHLHSIGLMASAVSLQKEAQVKYASHAKNESQLLKLLHKTIRTVDSIYDYTIEDERFVDKDNIEHSLYELNLLKIEQEGETIRDVNIWDEPDEKTQLFEGTDMKAGTLNKLVTKLTSEKEPDIPFMKTFLMTYQSFATPQKLLSKLIERFNIPSELEGNRGTTIQLRVCNVLKKWIEEYYSDFDQELIAGIVAFTQRLGRYDNKTMDSLRIQILKTMERVKHKDRAKTRVLTDKQPEPPKVNIKTIFSPRLSFLDIDEEELARQITLIDFEIYSAVRPQELLNQSWSKPKLKHRSPNVLKMIHFFNSVSLWVAVGILQMVKVKERAKVMTKFIKLAEHLKNLKNYNSLMALIAGMNLSPVQRLSWTRKEVHRNFLGVLADLEKLMSSEGSYSKYRASIASNEPPCIPYLGVYLTDLVFIDENPDYISGLVNFAKRKLVNNVISKFQQFQQIPYNLQPVYQIRSMLLKLPAMEEKELYVLSLSREPRKAQRHEIQ